VDEYEKALADMAAEPLELYEPVVRLSGQGGPGRGQGRKPDSPNGAKVYVSVRLDPDVHQQVQDYAAANKLSFNAAINAMLSAAGR
jgi:hypothetical protein